MLFPKCLIIQAFKKIQKKCYSIGFTRDFLFTIFWSTQPCTHPLAISIWLLMKYEYRYIVVVLGVVIEVVGLCTIVVDVQEISDILDLFPNHERH